MRELRELKTRVQAGFLAIDPRDGQIKAWVGSRDFVQDPLDHVQQARRQPGSTFKPFVYGAAFLEGAKPTDTLMDQAVEIKLSGGEIWRPTDETPPSGRAMSRTTEMVVCIGASTGGTEALREVLDWRATQPPATDATSRAALIARGYRVGALVIDAARFVPQSRPRVFFVAVRGDDTLSEHLIGSAPVSRRRRGRPSRGASTTP